MKLIVTGGAYGNSSYNVVITYYPGVGENLIISTIGVWLPPGFTYKPNSSNLGFEPVTSGYQGGEAIVWTLNSTPFTSLPGANSTDTPMTAKITFDYTLSNVSTTSMASSAASGNTTLSVATTSGFHSSGSLIIPGETIAVTYTGTTVNSFTGIPNSGGGSITINHSNGQSVTSFTTPEAVSWVNTSNVDGLSSILFT